MSIIGLVMNLVLISLLLAALSVGLRLNRRLKVLKDSQDGFQSAVQELNAAAARAEQGLADLRAATDEAAEFLADRIEKGRALATKLDRLVELAPARAPQPIARPVETDESEAIGRLGALLAAAREATVRPEPPPRREMPPLRREMPPLRRAQLDDELFEDAPARLGVRR